MWTSPIQPGLAAQANAPVPGTPAAAVAQANLAAAQNTPRTVKALSDAQSARTGLNDQPRTSREPQRTTTDEVELSDRAVEASLPRDEAEVVKTNRALLDYLRRVMEPDPIDGTTDLERQALEGVQARGRSTPSSVLTPGDFDKGLIQAASRVEDATRQRAMQASETGAAALATRLDVQA